MNKDQNERFWDASIEELKTGYIFDEESECYHCLLCEKSFERGVIYFNEGNALISAEKAVKNHVGSEHGSVFNYLIKMDKEYTGLTPVQTEVLEQLYQGLTDKDIVEQQGKGSASTIRNHRFKLKEKTKQAKIFLVIMELFENQINKNSKMTPRKSNDFITIHKDARQVDNRFNITYEEYEKAIATYFEAGKLKTFPSKEKRKIIVLQYMMNQFEKSKEYTEHEVNEILKAIYEDYVTIRRYLIEYGFMGRNRDCSAYWVK